VESGIDIAGRAWTITCVQNQDILLDHAEEMEQFPFGLLIWESSIAMALRLAATGSALAGKSVLELGAGVGLPGLVARSIGAEVAQTDHQAGALALADRNAQQNGIEGIRRFLADWRSWTVTERFDLILGSDILYERGMHFYVEQILKQNLKPGGEALLSDPGRPQALEFVAGLERRGWDVEMETTVVAAVEPTAPGGQAEVALITCRYRG
jgi:predicted nicotinamide N-methyase